MTQNFVLLLICNQQDETDFTDFSYCKINRVISIITLIKKNQQTKQIPSGERYAVLREIRGEIIPSYLEHLRGLF